jgi:hypothetical protein
LCHGVSDTLNFISLVFILVTSRSFIALVDIFLLIIRSNIISMKYKTSRGNEADINRSLNHTLNFTKMNNYSIILFALGITVITTGLVAAFFRHPIKGLWMFAIIVFLATWAGQLWIPAVGPVSWGVSWVSILFMPIFFWVFILALIPPQRPNDAEEKKETSLAMGAFFWILLIALLAFIGSGYYRARQTLHPALSIRLSDKQCMKST